MAAEPIVVAREQGETIALIAIAAMDAVQTIKVLRIRDLLTYRKSSMLAHRHRLAP